MIVFASKHLFAELNDLSIIFLVSGGIFYTLGVLFYIWKSREFTHAIWHFMVLAGTIMHFFAILYGVVLK
jgi:hemolysin III